MIFSITNAGNVSNTVTPFLIVKRKYQANRTMYYFIIEAVQNTLFTLLFKKNGYIQIGRK